ncbi:excisionase family DNA-binding protein [Metabacillus herbersteinensis]|uniref:Excisionase family DNA-binding protein n=1 Tax=Metabacillus herbersteinensis TaxID=283816 RepID=A0ABV6GJ52_9BACI
MVNLYLTINEASEYLSMPESYIKNLIHQKRIRAVHDGEQFLIYKEQFNEFTKQLENYKKQLAEFQNEPIPEDIDVKDED